MIEAKAKGKINFEDFFKIPKNAVKAMGVNLSSQNESRLNAINLYYTRFWFISGVCLMNFLMIKLILESSSLMETSKTLPNVLTGYFNLYKGYLMYTNQEELKRILEVLRKLFPVYADDQEERKILETLRRLLRMKRIYLTLYLSLVVFVFVPTVLKFLFTGEREMRADLWIPFNLDTNIKYLAFNTWLIWIMVSFLLCGFGTDFILFSTVTCLSMEFQALKEEMKKIINENGDLKRSIVRHGELIQLSNDVQKVFNSFLLLYISQSSLVVSLMTFTLAVTNDVFYLSFLIVSLNQIFLVCYFGQKLYEASSGIYNGILESNWFEVKNLKTKKMLIFITQRSQRPKILSASGFAVITLNSFMGVKNI